MALDNIPEPLDVLRARYPAALDHVYDVVTIRDHGGIRPGEIRAHVFDHEDGLRLLVSRERMPDGRLVLHVSASFPVACRIADEMRLLWLGMTKAQVMQKWVESIPGRFRELSGDEAPLAFVGWSENRVPHWVREEEGGPCTG